MTYRDDRRALHERVAALTGEIEQLRASKRPTDDAPPTDGGAPDHVSAPRLDLRIAGALVLVVSLVGVGAYAMSAESSESVPGILARVPGSPMAVDPLAGLALAFANVPAGYALTGIDAWHVSDDGSIDMTSTAYRGRVEYNAAGAPTASPEASSSAPLGARPSPTLSFVPEESFTLDRAGLAHSRSQPFGLITPPRVPRPHCSTREVWAAARTAGAPAGAVAHLSYAQSRTQEAPSWSFEISDTPYRFEISDLTCRVESKPSLHAPVR